MSGDPASLDHLNEVIVPPPAPFWPPAPGWYVVISLLLLLGLAAGIWAIVRFRRNAYRRAASAELKRIREGAMKLEAIASLLKRTALATYPRGQIAGLIGDAWIQWLAETSGDPVPPEVAAALTRGVYKSPSSTDSVAVMSFADRWIRRHGGGPSC
jgi:hypothetical protein